VCGFQRRVKALQTIGNKRNALYKKFRDERRALEMKYEQLYVPMFNKRTEIVTGKYEPTDAEAGPDAPPLSSEEAKAVTGVPNFWLTAMKNHIDIADAIQEKDEGVLKYERGRACARSFGPIARARACSRANCFGSGIGKGRRGTLRSTAGPRDDEADDGCNALQRVARWLQVPSGRAVLAAARKQGVPTDVHIRRERVLRQQRADQNVRAESAPSDDATSCLIRLVVARGEETAGTTHVGGRGGELPGARAGGQKGLV
jgi:hypothetical protein